MTDPSRSTDPPRGPGRSHASSRPRCPRCGAALGVLDAAPDADGGTTSASWYCGCCGLVLAPTAPEDATDRPLDAPPS